MIQYGIVTMNTPNGPCTVPLNLSFKHISYWVTGWFYGTLTDDGNARTRYGATQPYTVSSFQIGTYSGSDRKIRYLAIGEI